MASSVICNAKNTIRCAVCSVHDSNRRIDLSWDNAYPMHDTCRCGHNLLLTRCQTRADPYLSRDTFEKAVQQIISAIIVTVAVAVWSTSEIASRYKQCGRYLIRKCTIYTSIFCNVVSALATYHFSLLV
ncbi:hypothetical protein V8C42DRAFT_312183 [Trichoderma barbatum]